ncbi:DUF4126 domain-containing protein [Thiolapillus sp.]
MESQTLQSIALMLGAGWASGINLYAAMLVLGWMGVSGQVQLPPGLEVLTHPLVMGAAGLMFVVEFFADKIPGVDSLWDTLHTFIRIPAGALMAAAAAQGLDMGTAGELTGLILGGGLATTSHVSKASTRALINTSPEPLTNWTASVTEDVAVVGGLWTALHHPWLFVLLLVLFIILAAWLLPKIWRLLKTAGKTLFSWFRKPGAAVSTTKHPSGE